MQDLTVETRVGHPPVHKGCDCILMPGSERSVLPPAELRALLADIAGAGAAETPSCSCANDDRNAYIRAEYPGMMRRYGREAALTELRERIAARAESDGWTPIGERQIWRIAKPGKVG